MKRLNISLACVLSVSLILLSPGLPCYQALAAEVNENQHASEDAASAAAPAPLELSNWTLDSQASEAAGPEAFSLGEGTVLPSDGRSSADSNEPQDKEPLAARDATSDSKMAASAGLASNSGKSWWLQLGSSLVKLSVDAGIKPGPKLEGYLGRFYDRSELAPESADPALGPEASPAPAAENHLGKAGAREKALADVPAPSASAGAAHPDAPGMRWSAVRAWIVEMGCSVAAFIFTSMAYPMVAKPLVGAAKLSLLLSWGPLAIFATLLIGLAAQRLSVRHSKALNAALMSAAVLAMPALGHFGFLNPRSPYLFATLLLGSFANNFMIAVLLVMGTAYFKLFAGSGRFKDKNFRTLNAISQAGVYLPLQIILSRGGLPFIPSFGRFIDQWLPMTPFYVAAAILLGVAVFDLMFMPYEMLDGSKPPTLGFGAVLSDIAGLLGRVPPLLKRYAAQILAAATAAAGFVYFQSQEAVSLVQRAFAEGFPLVAASLWWISSLESSRKLWKNAERGWSAFNVAVLRSLVYPVQYFAWPLIAIAKAHANGQAAFLGEILSVFFLGQLLGISTQIKLADVDLGGFVTVKARRFVQLGALGLVASLLLTSLAPGNLAAAAAAVVFSIAAIAFGESRSAANWVQDAGWGMGLALIAVSLLPHLPFAAFLLATMIGGFFYGPATVVWDTYSQDKAGAEDMGASAAVRSAWTAGALMLGYFLIGRTAALSASVLLGGTLPFGILLVAFGGFLTLFAPALVPGLFKKSDGASPAVALAEMASYRVRQLALAALAVVFGLNFSLGAPDAAALGLNQAGRPETAAQSLVEKVLPSSLVPVLRQLREADLFVFDYDNTVADDNDVPSPKIAALFRAMRRKGKTIVIITNRGDVQEKGSKQRSVFKLLSALPADAREGIIVASRAGSRIFEYDGRGVPRLIYREKPFEETFSPSGRSHQALIQEAASAIKPRLAEKDVRIQEEWLKPYYYKMVFPVGTPEKQVRKAGAWLQNEFAARGLPYAVQARASNKPDLPPCLLVTRSDKFEAARTIIRLKNLNGKKAALFGDGFYKPAGKGRRFIPKPLLEWAKKLGERLSGGPMPQTGNDADAKTAKAFPGALLVSVGGAANPLLNNVVVAPGTGPAMTENILSAAYPGTENK